MFLSSSRESIESSRAVSREWRSLKICLVICFVAALKSSPLAAAPSQIQYNRDIRPILVENCFACHGPDSASRKAALRLDQRDMAIKGGAIAPGKPDESDLVQRIFAADPDDRMPPKASAKKLTEKQKEMLRRWVV